VIVVQALEDHAPQGHRRREQPVVKVKPRLFNLEFQLCLLEQVFENMQALDEGTPLPPFRDGLAQGIRAVIHRKKSPFLS
jgi:hypothetical protein